MNILSEVCSDVTNVLGLEAAVRREHSAQAKTEQTKLCTSHRQLRAQVFDGKASFAHFRVLALCTAGRTKGNFVVETTALIEHINYYVSIIRRHLREGYHIKRFRIELLPFTSETLRISEAEVTRAISDDSEGIDIAIDRSLAPENGYFEHMRFKMFASDESGNEYNIVDGGFTTWTQELLNNKKEFLLTSGLGTERMVYCFGAEAGK